MNDRPGMGQKRFPGQMFTVLMSASFMPASFIFGVLLLFPVSAVEARVSADQIAIIVNQNDAASREIAHYYRDRRGIPTANIIEVSLPVRNAISEKTFRRVFAQLENQVSNDVQYYALAWSRPFRAGCMSITSAFTFGYNELYCAQGCKPTRHSVYYNDDTTTPYSEYGIRPSMMLAGSSVAQVKAMIDRGVASDASMPKATAYLMSTSDRNRNVRSRRYPVIEAMLSDRIDIEIIHADSLQDKHDVMFYFTGLKQVEAIDSNTFLPGAVADHLTSAGGRLFGGRQMSLLEWLDAGATASYGTVVEPCAFTQKFPNPGIVIERYINGESLVEAYWKSVAWPGQGVFVGELMATPYAGKQLAKQVAQPLVKDNLATNRD
jgi:uncharacterized protein (TIGR03790 family)